MRYLIPVLVAIAGVAHADGKLPPLVVVASVTASSSTTDDPWSVLDRGGSGSGWCVDTSKGGVGESLAIVFDPPATIDAMTVVPGNYATRLTGLDVEVDGRTQRVTKQGARLEVPLRGKPITRLVLKVATFDKGNAPATCVSTLQFRTDREVAVVYGATAAEAAGLEKRVLSIRTALKRCARLGTALAFPFSYAWRTMTRDGLDEKKRTFANAARATAACQRGTFGPAVRGMALGPRTIVAAVGPGKLRIVDGEQWNLELRNGMWMLASMGDF